MRKLRLKSIVIRSSKIGQVTGFNPNMSPKEMLFWLYYIVPPQKFSHDPAQFISSPNVLFPWPTPSPPVRNSYWDWIRCIVMSFGPAHIKFPWNDSQCFAIPTAHQNYLEGFVDHRLLGSASQVSHSLGERHNPRICSLTSSHLMLNLLVRDHTLRITGLNQGVSTNGTGILD